MKSHRFFLYTFLGLVLRAFYVLCLPAPLDPEQPRNQTSRTQEFNTSTGKVYFASEPVGRGTWGIIFSSTATFIFCVWTSVHPNIIPNVSTWDRVFYRAILTIVSIVVPEGMIMCAYSQWLEAKEIKEHWESYLDSEDDRDYLGMDGAFFVVMGGFVVDVKPEGAITPIKSRHLTRLPEGDQPEYTTTLTASGFVAYLKEGRINANSFDKKAIVDKGKSNNVAKLLSGTQTLWLAIQCISRWKSGMRITLLEIHVLIQVVCTIIIYVSWWNKPFDVNEPLSIKIWQSKQVSTPSTEPDSITEVLSNIEDCKATAFNRDDVRLPGNRSRLSTNRIPTNLLGVLEKAFYDIVACIGDSEQTVKKMGKGITGYWPMFAEGALITINGLLHAAAWNVHFPSKVELWMWRGSSIGVCIFPLTVVFIAMGTSYHQDLIDALWDFQQCEMTVIAMVLKAARRINKIAKKHSKKEDKKKEVPPPDDGDVARTSPVNSESPTLAGNETNDKSLTPAENETEEEGEISTWKWLGNLLLIAICLVFLLVYVICILFITVESYISIRNPPEGVFLTPRWNDYWPHL